MATLKINGTIGWDVSINSVKNELSVMNGDDMVVEIDSSGGSVFHGLSIFNAIRDYKKENNAQVTVRIGALCASMATYISTVGDIIEANDNSVFMIHNAWNFIGGDHNEMRKNADILENLSNISAKAYSKQTGKSIEEIKTLMDAETWLFGDEIKSMGFADNIIGAELDDAEEALTKESAVALAKEDFKAVMSKSNDAYENEINDERLVAMISPQVNSKQENVNMEKEVKEALATDRKRVSEIMANIPANMLVDETITQMVADGKSLTEVKAFLFDTAQAKDLEAREALEKEVKADLENVQNIDGDSLDEKAKQEAVKADKISQAMKIAEGINSRTNGVK